MNDHTFYLVKGLVGFAGVTLLAFHLWRIRGHRMPDDQRWRFAALFLTSSTITYASYDQLADGDAIETRAVLGMITAIVVLVAAVKTLRAHRRSTR